MSLWSGGAAVGGFAFLFPLDIVGNSVDLLNGKFLCTLVGCRCGTAVR